MAAGGSQVPAAGNVGHWNAVVGEVRRCLIPETPVDSHGKLVLYSLRDVEPVQYNEYVSCRRETARCSVSFDSFLKLIFCTIHVVNSYSV